MSTIRVSLGAAFCLALAACLHAPQREAVRPAASQDKAASTHLAVLSVEDWDAVAPSLAPNFPISGESALAQAVPLTTSEIDRFLGALTGQFSLGLPQSSSTTTRTLTLQNGQQTTDQAQTV